MTGFSPPIGVSTWVWSSPISDEELERLAPRVRRWGFDVIELPIETLGDWNPERTVTLLASVGLGATVCAVMSAGRDLTTTDQSVTRATQDYLKGCVDVASSIGAGVVAGPMYSPVGKLRRLSPAERAATMERLVDALQDVAHYAAARGVQLALEPLNRFETSLINTVEQALEVVRAVDSRALGVCLDTFHMNIEEKDPAAAARTAGRWIAHVQACGTDRGTPGADRFDWVAFMATLADVAYPGAICIESFTADNDAIATAAAIWRPLARSQDVLATDGLAFLRSIVAPSDSRMDGRDA